MSNSLIPTTLVGSYPQPDWLVHKDILLGSGPPRIRMRDVWRPTEDLLQGAQDDATLVALHDQERAGIDIVSDGEVRRESYFNRFANALDGIDVDNPATVPGRTGKPTLVPRVVGPIKRKEPVQVRDVAFLRAHTDKSIKITIPGAFTMAKMAADEHYGDQEALIMAYADVLNEEVREMKAAGADVIQRARICFLPKTITNRLFISNPELGAGFLQRTAQALGAADERFFETVTLPARVRFIHLLMLMRKNYGSIIEDGSLSLELPLTRRDIASMLGIKAESLSRVVRDIESEGLAHFSGKRIKVANPNLLLEELDAGLCLL